MSSGKTIAQAGHAYTETLIQALSTDPESALAYMRLSPGTKIALDGGPEQILRHLFEKCTERGVPCRIVVDSGHVELPDFDGSPVVTALGIGPVSHKVARKILSRLPLWHHDGGRK